MAEVAVHRSHDVILWSDCCLTLTFISFHHRQTGQDGMTFVSNL